jgi:hypothetical protein
MSEFLTETQAQAQHVQANNNNDEIELIFIQDNPMARVKDEDRPRGSFLFLPMRNTKDKIFYGTGMAYFLGIIFGFNLRVGIWWCLWNVSRSCNCSKFSI